MVGGRGGRLTEKMMMMTVKMMMMTMMMMIMEMMFFCAGTQDGQVSEKAIAALWLAYGRACGCASSLSDTNHYPKLQLVCLASFKDVLNLPPWLTLNGNCHVGPRSEPLFNLRDVEPHTSPIYVSSNKRISYCGALRSTDSRDSTCVASTSGAIIGRLWLAARVCRLWLAVMRGLTAFFLQFLHFPHFHGDGFSSSTSSASSSSCSSSFSSFSF